MNYLGKLVGGLAGLVSGKWPLVLFGVLVGHQFDRGFARYAAARLPANFATIAFAVMGHIAKADGRVSEAEIRIARKAMHALDLDAEGTRDAMQQFSRGKLPDFSLGEALQALRAAAPAPHATGRQLVAMLLPMVLIKDHPADTERRILWQVCQAFDIGRVELAQLEAATRIETFRPDATGATDAAGRAFASLELAPDASDREIKKAYRRLMNRYHPDKLAGSDASEAAMADAARKTREVREAYELLRQRRGFR